MDFFGYKRYRMEKSLRSGTTTIVTTPIKKIMSEYVVTISPDKSAVEAATVMVGESVSAIVVERDDKPLGIVTERDFINKVPLSNKVFNLPVKEIMGHTDGNPPVFSVQPENTVIDAWNLLQEHHIRKIVVTSKDGLIEGMVTQTDLCRLVYDHILFIAKTTDVPLKIRDVMTPKIISVSRESTFAKAKQLMMKNNLTCMPITDEGEFIGIFTEYDVTMQFYDSGGKLMIKTIPEIMKRPVKVIPADLNIFEANAIMIFEKVRRLLVMDEGKIIGILSQTDLVRSCYQYVKWAYDQLQNGRRFEKQDFEEVKGKDFIVSKYAGPNARMYTVQ